MSYIDSDVTRADQVDQGAGTHTVRGKQRNAKTYQVVMPNDVDGEWEDSGGPLVSNVVATANGGSVYEAQASMSKTATNESLWILLYDLASTPTGSDTPFGAFPVFKGGISSKKYNGGKPLTNGLAMAASQSLSSLVSPGENVIRFEWNADELGTV